MRRKLILLAVTILVLIITASLVACTKAAPSTSPSPQPSVQGNNGAPPGLEGQPGADGRSGPPGGFPGGLPPGAAPAASATPATPAVTVRGQGTISIGTYANLYFGTSGQIARINIKLGDRVKKGAVLAQLDTATLESALAQAKVNLDQAVLAQTQAKSALASAQFNLDKTEAVSDIKDEITRIQWNIQMAEMRIQADIALSEHAATDYWVGQINSYNADLAKQNMKLADLLDNDEYTGSGALTYNIMGQTYDRLTVEDAHMKQLAIETAQQTLDKSQDSIDQARKNLDLARKQLDQATITAPFDGLVATLNGNAGDILPAPAQSQKPVIYLIDPTTMELGIQVNELDVPEVKLGQKASVGINAFPDQKLEGAVSKISTLPTVQGGIVDYTVTITFKVPSNLEVRIGMNATATMTVEK